MTNKDNYCVIMGGGIGSRFWPFSRKTLPKQFLDFFGTGRSLLQQTFDRFQKVIPTENEAFDTEFHEAITTFPAPSEDLKGKIIDCASKGYTLNEKVIRFSQVVVGE